MHRKTLLDFVELDCSVMSSRWLEHRITGTNWSRFPLNLELSLCRMLHALETSYKGAFKLKFIA